MATDFDHTVLQRLPLADAILTAGRWALPDDFLDALFERHRGVCYKDILTFPTLVHVIADALLQYRGSGRQSFAAHREASQLPVSDQAVYQKLSRLPLGLSEAFLGEGTARLQQIFPPTPATAVPASLCGFRVQVIDGKAIKRVAKRLKAARGTRGGVLGGKALCSLDLATGLVVEAATDADGEVNDAKLVPALLPKVRARLSGPRLWVADRQFCDLKQTEAFTAADDHFLVRYHPKTHFTADAERPAASGVDGHGRVWRQDWGWLGRQGAKGRRYVRRITLERPGEEAVILLTSLLDAVAYPAADLLELYLRRWRIERVFLQLTEVFHLPALIGTTPQGTVFQLCFCLWLYNLLQVVRAYVAAGQQREADTVSVEMLFGDVRRQLVALHELVAPGAVVELLAPLPTAAQVQEYLRQRLAGQWSPLWAKAVGKKRRPHPVKEGKREHSSMARILAASRQKKMDSPSGP
jgi:DDE family transposase